MKVVLELSGFLKYYFDQSDSGRVTLNEDVSQETTIRDLIRLVGDRNAKFGDLVFESDGKEITRFVVISLNGRVITTKEQLDQYLKDGDMITMHPVFAGG